MASYFNRRRSRQALDVFQSLTIAARERPAVPEYDDGGVVRKVQVRARSIGVMNTPSERRFAGSQSRRGTTFTMPSWHRIARIDFILQVVVIGREF